MSSVPTWRAASSMWRLCSADAIHLATALRVEAVELVTYDYELAEASRWIGLHVCAPAPRPR
jgi:predicted nucleic acid-binding protein